MSDQSDQDGDELDDDVDKVESDQAGDGEPLAEGRCLHVGPVHVNILQEVFKTHLKESLQSVNLFTVQSCIFHSTWS